MIDRLNNAIEQLQTFSVRIRLKWSKDEEISAWNECFVPGIPAAYFELPTVGPVLWSEVEWVEVETVQRKYRGRLVSDELVDWAKEIEEILQTHRLRYESKEGAIRILVNGLKIN